jgi:hypothetical protein
MSASLRQAPVSLSNIRLGWKGFPLTSTLAYYECSLIENIKSFFPVDAKALNEKN